jgi:16S rRNA (guanine527-N7)-methyltransferase
MPAAERARIERLLVDALSELLPARAPDEPLARALTRLTFLLYTWSARINLTGHRDPESIARKLVLEALALASVFPERPSSLADLGSGAGFPGLPLALLWPECRVTLVEARHRRHHFQRAAVREVGISNVHPVLGRGESLDPVEHDLAVARAVAPLPALVPWALRWIRPGGFLVVPGPSGQPVPAHPELLDHGWRSYRVPPGAGQQTVWLGERRLFPATA